MLVISRSAVMSQQERLATISQNLTNADTVGYHRRTTLLGTMPVSLPGLYRLPNQSTGNGVTVMDVVRIYNATQESMLRSEQSTQEYHAQKGDALAYLESLLNGMGDGSMADRLDAFWGGWQDVANNPANSAARGALIERAAGLTDYFNTMAGRLDEYRQGIVADGPGGTFTGTMVRDVNEVNTLASQIQTLNRSSFLSGGYAKVQDLQDKRDQALGALSRLVDITVADDGTVTIDGQILVSGDGAIRNTLDLTDAGTPPALVLDGAAVAVKGGSLRAWSDMTATVDEWNATLDSMADALVTDVNSLHTAAYDLNGAPGVEFFTGTDINGDGLIDADTLAVNPLLHNPGNPQLDNPRLIAAAATVLDPGPPPIPNAGDGTGALQIVSLASQDRPDLGTQTFSEYFTGKLATLGAAIQSENGAADDASAVATMLFNSIQAESGVSVDEEVADMMSTQRSYQAAAKLMSTIDDMLDLIINEM
jgi:flagellar hook-associated protein 1 FlgK